MSTKKMDRIDCRISLSVKDLAKDICEGLGMSLTEAVTLFLHQLILQNGLPFEVKLTSRDRKFFQRMKEPLPVEDSLVEVPIEAKLPESQVAETEPSAQGEDNVPTTEGVQATDASLTAQSAEVADVQTTAGENPEEKSESVLKVEPESKVEPGSKAKPESKTKSESKEAPVLLADFPELSGMQMSELTEDAEIAELGDGDLMDSEELLQ